MDEFKKQPDEILVFPMDFSDWLATGETISTKTIVATDESDDSVVTSTVIDTSAISGDSINIKVKAGTDLHDYKVTCKIVTSDDNTSELDVLMKVRAE